MLIRLMAATCGLLLNVSALAQAPPPVHLQSEPDVILVADLGPEFDSGAISEVAAADVDRDGARDIVVAWYATDAQNYAANLRFLTIFYGNGVGGFVRGSEFNLYIRNASNPQRSIFANGTAAMALGDFDADGDLDIAVTPNFGDEIWFIENLGARVYTPRFKHLFGIDQTNLLTPPEAVVGDFDGDGRADLAYLIDPTARINFTTVVFWQTSSTLANIVRRNWSGVDLGIPISYTRGLAVADFNNDGRADLCFSGVQSLGQEVPPALAVFWYGLNAGASQFSSTYETIQSISSDAAAVVHSSLCDPTLVFSDRNGSAIESWNSTCGSGVDYAFTTSETGFDGGAIDRGMAVVSADLNGDGFPDLVTRQKSGPVTDCRRVEIALGIPGAGDWFRLPPTTLSTCGFFDTSTNGILRPRNLAVADLFWNTEPEIIAGFGPTNHGTGLGKLEVAIWPNSCRGDLNHDGSTDVGDLSTMLTGFGCVGLPGFNPEADLDRSNCVDMGDLSILLSNFGCHCCDN